MSPNKILFIILLIFVSHRTDAHQDVTVGVSIFNVHTFYRDIPSQEQHEMVCMLGLALHRLSKALKKENVHIVINHNLQYNQYDEDLGKDSVETRYDLAIGYGTIDRHILCDEKPHPTLTIYYRGDFSIEKYMQIAYFSLINLDEIQRKQKDIWLPYKQRAVRGIAVSESLLNINYKNSEVIKKVLSDKIYNFWFDHEEYLDIGYYFQNNRYHVVQLLSKPTKSTAKNSLPMAEYKELFSLNSINEIIKFPNDYWIFDTDTTLYYIHLNPFTHSGPYKTSRTNNYNIFKDGFYKRYQVGDTLILAMYYSNLSDELYYIYFDKKRKKLWSNYALAKFRSIQNEIYGINEWDRRINHLPSFSY